MKGFSTPILPSCELYSFLVVYICTFCLFDCFGVLSVVEGLLWCILFHQFGLNWTFLGLLCRVFCFGEILPVVRDFCSLSLCFFCFFFVPLPSLLAHGEQRRDELFDGIFAGMQWSDGELGCTEEEQPWHFLLCSSLWSLDNIAPWWICCDCQRLVFKTVWDCFCLL